jgi:hypothetical protein
VSMTRSSRNALTGGATSVAAMPCSPFRNCAVDLDLVSRGRAFRNLLVDVGEGVVDRVSVFGLGEVSEEEPLAQPLTNR